VDSTRSATLASPADAWQPLTFGGVAAFAAAPRGRLWVVAALVATLVTGAVLRVALTVWSPTLSTAIARLPAEGAIDNGRLVWPGAQAASLADNTFISLSVTPSGVPSIAQTADLQFDFRSASLTVTSLLGSVEIPYPQGYVLALSRSELEPLWGAWRPHVLAGIVLATFVGLLLLWAVLGILLAVPLRAYAFFVDRRASFSGCAKLAVAALLPGALIMGLAILAYSLGHLRVGELLIFNGVHLLVDTAYLLVSPLCLPSARAASPSGDAPDAPDNPFAVDAASEDTSAEESDGAPKSPFTVAARPQDTAAEASDEGGEDADRHTANPFATDGSALPAARARPPVPGTNRADDDTALNPS
jgi:hypothetical protein